LNVRQIPANLAADGEGLSYVKENALAARLIFIATLTFVSDAFK